MQLMPKNSAEWNNNNAILCIYFHCKSLDDRVLSAQKNWRLILKALEISMSLFLQIWREAPIAMSVFTFPSAHLAQRLVLSQTVLERKLTSHLRPIVYNHISQVMLSLAPFGRTSCLTSRMPLPAFTSLSTQMPILRCTTCPGWCLKTLWTV